MESGDHTLLGKAMHRLTLCMALDGLRTMESVVLVTRLLLASWDRMRNGLIALVGEILNLPKTTVPRLDFV